jgi:hypothetical protein
MEPVEADLVISRRDGFAIAFRLSTGQSWRLTPKAADVLEALQAGWNPEFGEVSGIEATIDEIRGTIAKLSEAGVFECPLTSASRRLSALALTVRPPRGVLARLIDLLGPSVLFVSGALVYGSWCYAGLDVRATSDAALGLGTTPLAWRESWLWAVPGLIALQLAHELGHALVLAGYTQRPVRLGIRFWRLLPQPFTDTRSIVTIPRRRQRLTVLLAGTAGELICWSAIVVLLYLLGTLQGAPLLPVLLTLGPFAAVLLNVFLPFQGNDGYFVVSDLTGINHLRRLGARAALSLVLGDDESRPEDGPWWVSWYGVGDFLASGVTYGGLAGLVSAILLPSWFAAFAGCVAAVAGGLYMFKKSLGGGNDG